MTSVTITEIGLDGVYTNELISLESCEHGEHLALHWPMCTLAVADELVHTTDVSAAAMIMAMWLAHDGGAPFEFNWIDNAGISYTWRYETL
jgi:hypothetical protein